MHKTLAVLMGAALAMAAVPAQAAQATWQRYISKELGFSFMAPGAIKTELGTYRGADAGPRQSIVFRSVDDNIEYRVSVMSLMQAQADGATILGERQYMFQDKKKLVSDKVTRVETGKDMVYGRKLVVDQPDNKGRTTGAFYFNKGKLISLEATVLPGRRNMVAPEADRFVDSIAFVLARVEKGATELKTPELE